MSDTYPDIESGIYLEADRVWHVLHGVLLACKSVEDEYVREVWTPAYDRAQAGEGSIPSEIDAQLEAMMEARGDLEDCLLRMPAPDAAAFAAKVKIVRGEGRDLNSYDDVLLVEAARIAEAGR